jgi:hypothetical protein
MPVYGGGVNLCACRWRGLHILRQSSGGLAVSVRAFNLHRRDPGHHAGLHTQPVLLPQMAER